MLCCPAPLLPGPVVDSKLPGPVPRHALVKTSPQELGFAPPQQQAKAPPQLHTMPRKMMELLQRFSFLGVVAQEGLHYQSPARPASEKLRVFSEKVVGVALSGAKVVGRRTMDKGSVFMEEDELDQFLGRTKWPIRIQLSSGLFKAVLACIICTSFCSPDCTDA